jgi:hypothetical protein
MTTKSPVLETWTGTFDSNLGVTLTVPGRSECNGQRREYSRTFTGKLSKTKGKYELQTEADDVPCPDLKCSFKNRIKVRQK